MALWLQSLAALILSTHSLPPEDIPSEPSLFKPKSSSDKPNIIFVFADDVGFNDLGYHECTDTLTPFLDQLIKDEGLWLSNSYTAKICGPSRSSFLSGRYASTLGLQNLVFSPSYPVSLTRQVSVLSNEFKKGGYSTHIIGKWHLGSQSWEYTPTYRGFDTFSGFYNGYNYYYEHTLPVPCDMIYGSIARSCDSYYDLRLNELPDTDSVNDQIYGMFLERDQSLDLLRDLEKDGGPFFLYLALQAAHSPSEAPDEYVELYSNQSGSKRQYTQAQVTILDETMEAVVNQLKESRMWENTLIVFQSDNGAPWGYGDNFPLRGYKNSSFEGGIRVPAFVTGGYLAENRRGVAMDSIIVHVSDWYQTLLSAAGLSVEYARSSRMYRSEAIDNRFESNGVSHVPLDGEDLWSAIQFGTVDDSISSESRELLLDINVEGTCQSSSCGAIRSGKWKYLRGANMGVENDDADLTSALADDWTVQWRDDLTTCDLHPTLNCGVVPEDANAFSCYQDDMGCLFDLESDPCEYYNVGSDYPKIRNRLMTRLDEILDVTPGALISRGNELNTSVYAPESSDSFWGPFMRYDSVVFERELTDFYLKLYPGSDDDSDSESDSNSKGFESENEGVGSSSSKMVRKESVTDVLFALYLVAMAVIVAIYWCCWFRKRRHHHIEDEDAAASAAPEHDKLTEYGSVPTVGVVEQC